MIQPSTKHQALSTKAGFSLIEITVVLSIIAVVIAGAMTLFTVSLEGRSYRTTQARLANLQKALYNYRLAYNQLPCPADLSLVPSNANYGVAATDLTDCAAGSPPTANLSASNAAYGMIPVRTLGLPDEAAFDGWGRRIAYGVSIPFVAADAFSSIGLSDTTTRLTIKNLAGTNITTTAAFVLVSYSKNGHGAYSNMTAQAIDVGVTNTNELKNCKRSGAFALETTNIGTYIQGDETPDSSNVLNNFDDMIVFSTRAQLRGAAE